MACPRSEECCTAVINAFAAVRDVVVLPENLVFSGGVPVNQRPARTEIYRQALDSVLARFRQALNRLNCECSGSCCVTAAATLDSITRNTLTNLRTVVTGVTVPTVVEVQTVVTNLVEFYNGAVDFILQVACACDACVCCEDVFDRYRFYYTSIVVTVSIVVGVFNEVTAPYTQQIRQRVQSALLQLLECQCEQCRPSAISITFVGLIYTRLLNQIITITPTNFQDNLARFLEDFNRFIDFVLCLACGETCSEQNVCCDRVLASVGTLVSGQFFNAQSTILTLTAGVQAGTVTQEFLTSYVQTNQELIGFFLNGIEKFACRCNNDCCESGVVSFTFLLSNAFRLLSPTNTSASSAQFSALLELVRTSANAILSTSCSNCTCCQPISEALAVILASVRNPNTAPAVPPALIEAYFRAINEVYKVVIPRFVEASCCALCCETVVEAIEFLAFDATAAVAAIPVNPVPTLVQYQAEVDAIIAELNEESRAIIDLACCRVPASRSTSRKIPRSPPGSSSKASLSLPSFEDEFVL